jgi:hypothetical protein
MDPAINEQGSGHPDSSKNTMHFNVLRFFTTAGWAIAALPFLPGGKICRRERAKRRAAIASAEYGLY